MTTLIDPSYSYGDISASEMQQLLLNWTRYGEKDFNIKMAGDTRVEGASAWRYFLNRFITHGLLTNGESGLAVSEMGLSLIDAKFHTPVERSIASKEIEGLKDRAQWILDDPDCMTYVRGIFIFGSYVDSKKEILGDLDVGLSLSLKPEYQRLTAEQQISQAKALYLRVVPEAERADDVDYLTWDRDNMLTQLKNQQDFTSIHLAAELPTLRVENILWVYDSRKKLNGHAVLDKTQLKMVNSYLAKTA